jgi:methionyl-tRNA formyltransferase
VLPLHRGGAPTPAARAAGDATTGVTTMLITEGLDTGPVLLQREVEISATETAGELASRLAATGAVLMVETLAGFLGGEIFPRPQEEALATYAPRLTREAARIDWMLPSRALYDLYRAHTPWPGMEARWRDEPVKLARVGVGEGRHADLPGTVLGVRPERITIACGADTALDVFELQRSGRRALSAADFANGERLRVGARFT